MVNAKTISKRQVEESAVLQLELEIEDAIKRSIQNNAGIVTIPTILAELANKRDNYIAVRSVFGSILADPERVRNFKRQAFSRAGILLGFSDNLNQLDFSNMQLRLILRINRLILLTMPFNLRSSEDFVNTIIQTYIQPGQSLAEANPNHPNNNLIRKELTSFLVMSFNRIIKKYQLTDQELISFLNNKNSL